MMNQEIAAILKGDKNWSVVQGDARETGLPDESIGLIITSPPYNIGIDYGPGKQADMIPEKDFHAFNKEWLKESFRVASNGCRMYVAVSEKMLWWFKPMAEEIGWTYSQLYVWCKTNFVAGTRRISGEWNPMIDWFLIMRKGDKIPMLRWAETNTVNWFVHATPQSYFNGDLKKIHPAQWPIPLIRRFIIRTPGDVVLDPFCGSGVVGISALRCGRRFIGMDLSDDYVASSCDRLKDIIEDTKYDEDVWD